MQPSAHGAQVVRRKHGQDVGARTDAWCAHPRNEQRADGSIALGASGVAGHGAQINLLKLQRRQLRLQALQEDKKAVKHYPKEMEEESDFDDDVRPLPRLARATSALTRQNAALHIPRCASQAAAQAEQVQVRMDAEKEEKLRIKAEQTGETYTPSSPTKKQVYVVRLGVAPPSRAHRRPANGQGPLALVSHLPGRSCPWRRS